MNQEAINSFDNNDKINNTEYLGLIKKTGLLNEAQKDLTRRLFGSDAYLMDFIKLYSKYFKVNLLNDLTHEEDGIEEKLDPKSPEYPRVIGLIEKRLRIWCEPVILENVESEEKHAA